MGKTVTSPALSHFVRKVQDGDPGWGEAGRTKEGKSGSAGHSKPEIIQPSGAMHLQVSPCKEEAAIGFKRVF